MKRLLSFLTAFFLLVVLMVPAAASEAPEHCIYDTEKLLEDEVCEIIEMLAQDISQRQQCAVYFLSVYDFRDYGDGDIFNVARQIYEENDLGMGENKDGVLLILSMVERDYCLLAHGFGDTALTDYGKDYISERFLDDFADDDWYGGVRDYLTYTDDLLGQAREGKVYDRGSWITGSVLWIWSLIIGGLVALMVCGIQRLVMQKKVRLQHDALGYLENNSAVITHRSDRYTHTTQVRQKIETNKDSGSGGHSHSGDYSGKSGKF